MSETYNGWTNHATWNAFNWISSDYAVQKALEAEVEGMAGIYSGPDAVATLAILIEDYHSQIWRDDLEPGEVETINWTEIAEAYME